MIQTLLRIILLGTFIFVLMILYQKRLLGYIQITRTTSHQISNSVSDGKRALSGIVTLWDWGQLRGNKKGKLKVAREQHSLRVREVVSSKNSKEMWNSVKEMTNSKSDRREMHVINEMDEANELNHFYKRFDSNVSFSDMWSNTG